MAAMLGSQWIRAAAAAAAVFIASFSPASLAQDAEPEGNAVGKATWEAAMAAMVHGPNSVQLKDQAQLALPAGYGFVPPKEGAAVMDMLGNQIDERFVGLIFPQAGDSNWFVTVDYEPSGYIKDDDAKEWDADELLQSLKDGTEAANEHRRDIGVAEIQVTRWVEKPAYDAQTHRLVWSAEAREKGGEDTDPVVNYNTYVLGREGYVSLNLITSSATVEADKPAAHELLAAVDFNDGKRYGDFNSSTDKVAAYGLAALVGGLAAKKLGLLAAAGVFIAKFAKVIIIGVAAAGSAVAKFLKGRSAGQA
ncbi:MAG: DUF2167 domain-containing protein [Steroidobacteraceae bacterium]